MGGFPMKEAAKDGAVTLPGGAVLPVPGCPEGTLRMGIRPEAWTPGKTIGVRLGQS